MNIKDPEINLLDYYSRKVRMGFPIGEIKGDMLANGYSATEADKVLAQLNDTTVARGIRKEKKLGFYRAYLFIAGGIVFYLVTRKFGIITFVIGLFLLLYEIYKRDTDNKDLPPVGQPENQDLL